MSYIATKPLDTQTIASAPGDIRTNFEGLRTGRVVDAGLLNGLVNGNATGNIPVSNGTVCTNLNAEKVGGNLPSAFATAGHGHTVATASSDGLMSNADFIKLAGVATGAEVNQNAFGSIIVGATTIQSDSETDSLTLIAGANITLTGNATNDSVTIEITGTVPSATTAGSCTGNSATATTATTTAGNAGTATKLATARTINGVSFDGTVNIVVADATKSPIDHSSALTTYGISNATEYGHTMASSAVPLVAGVGVAGTDNGKFAREGHVHPLQTTVNKMTNLGGQSAYKYGFTTDPVQNPGGSWGKAVMIYDANGTTYGVRVDRADVADSVPWSGVTGVPALGVSVSVLTGTIANGGTIPLPVGFTEAQCKWMVGWGNYPSSDYGGTYAYTVGRIAKVGRWHISEDWVQLPNGTANYIVIGVK